MYRIAQENGKYFIMNDNIKMSMDYDTYDDVVDELNLIRDAEKDIYN